jgi:hypothetical protein
MFPRLGCFRGKLACITRATKLLPAMHRPLIKVIEKVVLRLKYSEQVMSFLGNGPYMTGWHTGLSEFLQKWFQVSVPHRNQQATGGLGIKQESFNFLRNFVLVFHDAFRELAVGFQAARNVSRTHALDGARQERDILGQELH